MISIKLLQKGRTHPTFLRWGGIWGSNPRHPEPQSGALPTELIPPNDVCSIYNSVRRVCALARQEGFEPPTYCLEGSCSILLSYWRVYNNPAPIMERVMGIEPTYPAWKAGVLPLNYTRTGRFLIQPRDNTILYARLSTAFRKKFTASRNFRPAAHYFSCIYRFSVLFNALCGGSASLACRAYSPADS